MASGLLAISAAQIAIIVAAVVAVLAAVVGILKKFTRSSWVGYQIALLFAVAVGLSFLPETMDKTTRFLVAGLGFFGAAAIVLGCGAIVRHAFRARRKQANLFWRITDHLLGAVTAVINLSVVLLSIGAFVLAVLLGCFETPPEFIRPFADLVLWVKFGAYAPDLLLVAFLTVAMKAGYRLGLLRAAWAFFAIALSAVALFGSVFLTIRVSFLSDFASLIAGAFDTNAFFANVFGIALASLVVFVVLFLVIILLTLLVNLLMKRLYRATAFVVIDGMLLSAVFYFAAFAIVVGFGIGVNALARMDAAEGGIPLLSQVQSFFARLASVLQASPFGGLLVGSNPLIA